MAERSSLEARPVEMTSRNCADGVCTNAASWGGSGRHCVCWLTTRPELFSSIFEIGDVTQTGALFDVPVEVVPVDGIFKPQLALRLLSQGFTTLSEEGNRLESFDGSPEEVGLWLRRKHLERRGK